MQANESGNEPDVDAVDTAWRIHAASSDGTGKADQKASFTLAVESALALAVMTLSGDGKALLTMKRGRRG